RQEITLQLAVEFLRVHRATGCRFIPVGVAQGWSPRSYAVAVEALQKMGYRRIALGGIVPLKTPERLACLAPTAEVLASGTTFQLLGVSRCDQVAAFTRFGVVSFDSTSPLRQAFKDDRDNYYTLNRTYSAIRVPQVDANLKLQRLIGAGKLDQRRALEL